MKHYIHSQLEKIKKFLYLLIHVYLLILDFILR